MSFDVGADAYGRFIGRYSEPLAVEFARRLELRAGRSAVDVGCGPGAMTARLVDALGPGAVAAVDPSVSFVQAARSRFPGVDVHHGSAEHLPFDDDAFDCAVAQLVVHFMADPVAGLGEMGRVTRPGGVVAACVWDHASGSGPLAQFWRAVTTLDPGADDESGYAGTREGHLGELMAQAGLGQVVSSSLTVRVRFETFQDWWEPYTLGVGPAGAYVGRLDPAGRDALRAECARLVPQAPFDASARAWTAIGRP